MRARWAGPEVWPPPSAPALRQGAGLVGGQRRPRASSERSSQAADGKAGTGFGEQPKVCPWSQVPLNVDVLVFGSHEGPAVRFVGVPGLWGCRQGPAASAVTVASPRGPAGLPPALSTGSLGAWPAPGPAPPLGPVGPRVPPGVRTAVPSGGRRPHRQTSGPRLGDVLSAVTDPGFLACDQRPLGQVGGLSSKAGPHTVGSHSQAVARLLPESPSPWARPPGRHPHQAPMRGGPRRSRNLSSARGVLAGRGCGAGFRPDRLPGRRGTVSGTAVRSSRAGGKRRCHLRTLLPGSAGAPARVLPSQGRAWARVALQGPVHPGAREHRSRDQSGDTGGRNEGLER